MKRTSIIRIKSMGKLVERQPFNIMPWVQSLIKLWMLGYLCIRPDNAGLLPVSAAIMKLEHNSIENLMEKTIK